jgi:hypothetical protein
LTRKIHFRMEMSVDIKIVAQRCIRVHDAAQF